MYSILVDQGFGTGRNELMQRLRERGVDTRTFFIPMHLQPAFINMRLFNDENYPVAEELAERGLYLPSGSGLKKAELDYICNSIREIAALS
jgi:perosamine synthetase